MPARCPTCGEEALSEDARFCVGCGGQLSGDQPAEVVTAPATPEPPRPAPPPAPEPAPAWQPRARRARQLPPRRLPQTMASLRDPGPIVPLPIVLAAIAGLLALLLILIVAA